MLMPIVSMNKMAMNESVATTCCFREVATPTAIYWEVLHGGWIGSGYATTSGVKKAAYTGMKSSWESIKYDINLPTAAIPQLGIDGLKYLSADESGTNVAGWFVADNNDWSGSSLIQPLAAWLDLHQGNLITSGTCDHTPGSCTYYMDASTSFVKDHHFEATSAHDNKVKDWKVAHPAQAFAS